MREGGRGRIGEGLGECLRGRRKVLLTDIQASPSAGVLECFLMTAH